jgi:bacteriocin biosynthesis cyclodehydratase domain-containing protein
MTSGVSVVPLPGDRVLLRTDTSAVRLEGGSATFFVDRVLPLLDGRRPFSEICTSLTGVDRGDLRLHLDQLVEKGVLRRRAESPARNGVHRRNHMLSLLEDLGLDPSEAQRRLDRLSVAVVGLEGHGAHLAMALAAAGIGNLVLLDPYPCEETGLDLMPDVGDGVAGRPRQEVVQAAARNAGAANVGIAPAEPLTRDTLHAIAADVHLIVGCFDRGFSAANVWINEAALEQGIASVYADLRGVVARLGPLVFPGQTACYMCWRMRAIACETEFEDAMACEEWLDRRRQPALHERIVHPFLPAFVGSVLGSQILTSMLEASIPSLAGKIWEFNALTLRSDAHTVLQKPDCPACAGIEARRRPRWETSG